MEDVMKPFLQKHSDDLFLGAGGALIVFATYELNWIAALYVAGGLLMAAGIAMGIGSGRKKA
jgi:hypothetical protein